ncbi:MAG TPA: hypothetical protein VL943_02185, partial [Niabella sp.]|nr:hypothetical protein [Niabella sp.]
LPGFRMRNIKLTRLVSFFTHSDKYLPFASNLIIRLFVSIAISHVNVPSLAIATPVGILK